MEKQKMLAIAGFLALMPALILVVTGLSGLDVPKIFDSPFVILGGLALALATNLPQATFAKMRFVDGNFVSSVTVRLKDGLMNFTVIILSLVLFSIIALYLFLENFQPR